MSRTALRAALRPGVSPRSTSGTSRATRAIRAISRWGGMSERTTGHLHAIASRTDTGSPSPRDAETKTSARESRRYTSSRAMRPVKRTRSVSPISSTASTSCVLSAPSPTNSNRSSGPADIANASRTDRGSLIRGSSGRRRQRSGPALPDAACRWCGRGSGPPGPGPPRSARRRCVPRTASSAIAGTSPVRPVRRPPPSGTGPGRGTGTSGCGTGSSATSCAP